MSGLRCATFALLLLSLGWAGCATVRPPDTIACGPYPEDCDAVIERFLNGAPSSPRATVRTVSSVSEPKPERQRAVAGWGVWASVRESRPNAAGGMDVQEKEYHFLLRGDQVIASEYPQP
ncbi:MAG: hypothetical protein U1G07_13990 [Verrucomicrobiota bacterium]